MNKFGKRTVGGLVALAMAAGVGVAIGASSKGALEVEAAQGLTQTVSFENFSGGAQGTGDSISSTETGAITVNLSKGYKNSTFTHNYASGIITITGDDTVTKISKVVITASETGYTGAQKSGAYTVTTGGGSINISGTTITYSGGTAASAVFSHSKQLRFTQMVVTYDTNSSQQKLTAPAPSYSAGSVTWANVANAVSYDLSLDGAAAVHNAASPYDVSGLPVPSGHTVTVTAIGNGTTYLDSDPGSVKFAMLNKGGTQGDPYDVANAKAAIDGETGVSGVYATGIVSSIVTEYNAQYGNVTFDISADGLTTGEQLRAYRATGDEAENIAVGNIVVVSGDLTKYGSTYEFAQGCTIVSRAIPTYTVSYNANGGTGTMADVPDISGEYTLLDNAFTAPAGKMFAGWKANNAGDLLDKGTSFTVTGNVTFYAQWVNIVTVTYHANGGTGSDIVAEAPQGKAYTVAANSFEAPDGLAFASWNTAANGSGTKYLGGATINALNADLELFAQWDVPPEEVKDTITVTTIGASGTSYADYTFNGPSTNLTYKSNNCVKDATNIQIRSNSGSGLVSTTSKGTVKSVKITVASGENTIWVFGSNTAYTAPSDLYDNAKQGTKVGQTSSTATINFTSDYAYVGIRSGGNACYISSIEITWLITPKAVDHIKASAVTNPGPFYVGTKPTLAELGVTVTACYDAGETDTEVVTSSASITYPNTGLESGANNYTITYKGKTTTVSITGTVGDVYGKIHTTPDLIIGSTIRVGTDTYVMTATSASSQLEGAEADPTDANDTTGATFTVGADSEGYYFYEKTAGKYLALSSDSTNLLLQNDLNTNAHWTVSVLGSGKATIKHVTYSDRFIQKNNGTHRFGSYKGDGADISIFLLVDNDMTEEQEIAAQVETFSNLFMHKLDVPTSTVSNTGNCYGTDGSDGYFAKAQAALDGDWSSIAEAFSQSGDMWARYVKWGAACGIVVTYDGGIQYNANVASRFAGSSKGATPAVIMAVVSVISAGAIGGLFFYRKRRAI